MKTFNTALIQEDLLIDVILVLEHGWPIGPKFIYALGAIIEAIIIHDTIYFDPQNDSKRNDTSDNSIHSLIASSEIVRLLQRDGGLKLFPEEKDLKDHIAKKNIDYDFMDFIANAGWGGMSFVSSNPEAEANDYVNLIDLMQITQIFGKTNLYSNPIELESTLSLTPFFDSIIIHANALGFVQNDIKIIESYNRRSMSYLNLSSKLGMNLYSTFVSLPYQIGSIDSYNSKSKEIYNTVIEKITDTDEEIFESEFSRIKIPPLLSLVLEKAQDNPKEIVYEICELRKIHKKFRNYLTNYEKEWAEAYSREDRRHLKNEFENAWKLINTNHDKPSTRIIYHIWNIMKSPTKILQNVGDLLASKGSELSVINKVAGLYDFNNALLKSPLPKRNIALLKKTFNKFQPESVWKDSEKYVSSLNHMLNSK